MNKKTIYIIIAAAMAALLTAGALVWYFFFKSTSTPTTPQMGLEFTISGEARNGRLIPISKGVVSAVRFIDNDIMFSDFSGTFWQLKSGGTEPMPAEQPMDLNAVFSPDGKKIIYQISSGGINDIATSDSDGKNKKIIIKNLKLKDVDLIWPSQNVVAMISTPSAFAGGGLWTLNLKTLKITKVVGNLPGLNVLYAKDGKTIAYSYTDQYGRNPKLFIYKNGISKEANGNILTLIDKCAWADDSINLYCAVPQSWPESATLPDDYYKNTFSTADSLWKINTETGEKNLVFPNMGSASNLALSVDNNALFFISIDTGFLYLLPLK